MKALVLHGPEDLRLEDVQEPLIPKDHVLIRVKYVGICGTDIAIYKGKLRPRKLPIILGHEISGVIEDVGANVSKDLIGRNVVTEINITCKRCPMCIRGYYTHCINRKTLGISIDGGMTQYVVVPIENIHEVSIDLKEAVFTEPLAACLRLIDLLPLNIGYNVVILGQGPLAYLMNQVMKFRGFTTIIIGTRWERLKYFKNRADYVLNLNEINIIDEVFKITKTGADLVIEVTGNPEALNLALKLVRPTGVIAAKSTHGEMVKFDYTDMVVKEVQIVSSRCGLRHNWEKAIELIQKNIVKVNEIITHEYPLHQGVEAFKVASSKSGMKVIVKV